MKLLFVDDDADTTWTFKRLVEMIGHEATCTSNASEALAQARRDTPDFLFLDVLLGAEDGRTLYAALRNEPLLSRCKIFALTGSSNVRADCGPPLFDGFLLRPITLDMIERVLQGHAPGHQSHTN